MKEAWAAADGDRSAPDIRYRQLPPSPRVPLWIGGSSPAARRRAAATGDGWAPLFLTPDDYGPALAALRRETEAAGRHPDAVEPAVVIFARVGPDDEAPAHRREVAVGHVRRPTQGIRAPPGRRRAGDVRRPLSGIMSKPGPATSSSWWPAPAPCGTSSALRAAFMARSHPLPAAVSAMRSLDVSLRSVTKTDIAILGTGMTDMSRRDLSPETMAYQAAHEALADAGLDAGRARARHRRQRHRRPAERPGLRAGPVLAAQGRAERCRRSSTSTTPAPVGARRCISPP